MTEKDWTRFLTVVLGGVVSYTLLKYLGVANGFLPMVAVFLLVFSIFGEHFGKAAPVFRKILGITGVVLFLTSWHFTKRTSESGIHWAQKNILVRDTFDPETEAQGDGENHTKGAIARFVREPNGKIRKVPGSWKRSPTDGSPLAKPGTLEFKKLLEEYEKQELERPSKETATVTKAKAPGAYAPCTYVWWNGDSPNRFTARIISENHLEYRGFGGVFLAYWDRSGNGRWTSTTDRGDAGDIRNLRYDADSNTLRGQRRSEKYDHRGWYPLRIECDPGVKGLELGSSRTIEGPIPQVSFEHEWDKEPETQEERESDPRFPDEQQWKAHAYPQHQR